MVQAKATKVESKTVRFKDTRITGTGFEGVEVSPGRGPRDVTVIENGVSRVVTLPGDVLEVRYSAGFPLFLIHEAWGLGLNLEAEADGYGAGNGTYGDWSGIRDSTSGAIEKMLEKTLNFLFPTRLF